MKILRLILCQICFIESVTAMQLPVVVCNETNQKVILKDIRLKYSSIDIGPRRIDEGKNLHFNIIPVAGKDEESFNIVIGTSIIPIVLKWVKNKGLGPFIQQQDTPFRALKSNEPSAGVKLRIVEKSKLMPKRQAQECSQQCSDLQDLSEQTGFTQAELQSLQY